MVRFLFFLVAFTFSGISFAALEIYPKRVVFEPGQRSVEVTLINGSKSDAFSYRLKWRQIQYDSKTQVVNSVNGSHEGFITPPASKMIRFAPRQVVLKPGERQTVRVFLRRPKNLKNGEYRSHLLFEEQTKIKEKRSLEGSSGGLSMSIDYIIGISIPVLVRQGEGEPSVKIVQATKRTDSDEDFMEVKLEREGDYSSRVKFDIVQDQGDGDVVVGKRSYAGIYTDSSEYTIKVPLNENYKAGVPVTINLGYLGRGDKEIKISKVIDS